MSKKMSYEKIQLMAQNIHLLSEKIILQHGPFLKEGVYQDILVHELQLKGFNTSRELVFNYRITDSKNKSFTIGNNQSLRSDIELPEYGCILELKSSGNSTKDENVWQLRNYLENRLDSHWGLVINFISKFGPRTFPKVQSSLLIKQSYLEEENHTIETVASDGTRILVNKYFHENFESNHYPSYDQIVVDKNVSVPESVTSNIY